LTGIGVGVEVNVSGPHVAATVVDDETGRFGEGEINGDELVVELTRGPDPSVVLGTEHPAVRTVASVSRIAALR
jgi:hypothetical protein